ARQAAVAAREATDARAVPQRRGRLRIPVAGRGRAGRIRTTGPARQRAEGGPFRLFRARRGIQPHRRGICCMKTILITGAAGDVGTHLRRELAGKYVLRVSDLRSLKKINKEEKFVRADISSFADALRITKGVDAVVHLGGYSVEGPWDGILSANIIGCYNVFEAARRNGVKRILFPTSNHATGFYGRNQTIDHRV